MTEHNKHYYELDRNMSTTSNVNPKMKMSKEELGIKKEKHETRTGGLYPVGARSMEVRSKKNNIPHYYIGKHHKYEARKVIEDFELSYNIGTATTYLLRSANKHKSPVECIEKAIAHLQFELDKLKLK
tara:strand:- start:36 stop:419 length:384 start_codon:yes stop_codon:yes gene_type:complete